MSDSLIPVLFGVTLLAFLVYGVMQWWSARQARQTHEKSAMPPPDPTHPQQRSTAADATPGVSQPARPQAAAARPSSGR